MGVFGSQQRDCVVSTYKSQLGVTEATGKNDGPEVQAYLKTTGLKGNYPWCAAFVNWVLKKCGIKTINDARAGSWFKSEKIIYQRGKSSNKTPQSGDLCGFIWNGKFIQHIGFIDKWGENSVITVEGNTTPQGEGIQTREGDGVWRKRRMKRSIFVVADWID
jgi:uncharacterized protein (TIGR02594 family)